MPACVSVLQLVPALGARRICQLQGGDSTVPAAGNEDSREIVKKPDAGREAFEYFPFYRFPVKTFAEWTAFHCFYATHI